jgi:hypothetical protein
MSDSTRTTNRPHSASTASSAYVPRAVPGSGCECKDRAVTIGGDIVRTLAGATNVVVDAERVVVRRCKQRFWDIVGSACVESSEVEDFASQPIPQQNSNDRRIGRKSDSPSVELMSVEGVQPRSAATRDDRPRCKSTSLSCASVVDGRRFPTRDLGRLVPVVARDTRLGGAAAQRPQVVGSRLDGVVGLVLGLVGALVLDPPQPHLRLKPNARMYLRTSLSRKTTMARKPCRFTCSFRVCRKC